MTNGFDDHPTVVVLQFLLTRMIAKGIRESQNPPEAFLALRNAIELQKSQLQDFAFNSGQESQTITNAVIVMGEFDSVLEEITELVRA